MSYVYIQSEHTSEYSLYTVGFYDPSGKWHAESDHTDPDKAAERVNWLNGGNGILEKRVDKLEDAIFHAANTASCLANGILPD